MPLRLRHPWVVFLGVLAVVWLRVGGPDRVHPDTTRAWLMARDCADLDLCQPNGVASSVAGLSQGALWPLLLAVAWRLGVPIWLVGLALLTALAASVTWLAHQRGARVVVPLLAVVVVAVPDLQVEPTVQLIGALLTTSVALMWHRLRTWPTALLLGLCAGLTADVHVAGWLAVALGAVLGLWHGPRGQVVAALATAVAVSVGLSPQTWHALLHGPSGGPPAWAWRYVLALAPAVVVGATSWPWQPPRRLWVGMAACALVAAVVWWPKPRPQPSYRTVADLAAVAHAHGVGWPEAVTAVRGPHAQTLGDALGLFLPLQPAMWSGVVLDVAQDLTMAARVGQFDWRRALLCVGQAPCTPLQRDPTPPRTLYPWAARAWVNMLQLPAGDTPAVLTVPVRPDVVVTQPVSLAAHTQTSWSIAQQTAQGVTLRRTGVLQPGDDRLLPPLVEFGPPAPPQPPVPAPPRPVLRADDARPFKTAVGAALLTLVALLGVLLLLLRRPPLPALLALLALGPLPAFAAPPHAAQILSTWAPTEFPPLYHRALETFLTAEAAYRRGDYPGAQKILDTLWREVPPGDVAWKQFQAATVPLHTVADFGTPPCYAALRMLATCVTWRLHANTPLPEPTPIQLTVVLVGRSLETGSQTTRTLDAGLDDAHAAQVLDVTYGLFDEYVLAMTRGRLRIRREIVRLPTWTAQVTRRAKGDGRDVGSPVIQVPRPTTAQIWAAVPEDVAARTDIWHIVYPSQVPTDAAGTGERFVTGGMRAGPDGSGTPCFVSDDAKLLRAANQNGRHVLSDAERHIALSQWLQHEFFHHLFAAYPQLHLEDKPHQWHNRQTWPADFTGMLEADYYAEALQKRLLRSAQPPLSERLHPAGARPE